MLPLCHRDPRFTFSETLNKYKTSTKLQAQQTEKLLPWQQLLLDIVKKQPHTSYKANKPPHKIYLKYVKYCLCK